MTSKFAINGAHLIVSILFILKSGSGVFGEASNGTNDNSICRRYHRVPGSRLVSYRETYAAYEEYDYSNAEFTRVNFRIENFTKWEMIEMCCEGFEPHLRAADAEKCVPICLSDCVNGWCAKPNECMCNDGYAMRINNLTKYSECIPVCPSGCHGGYCVGPNICACDYGYQSTNGQTKCEPTCSGVLDSEHHRGCGGNASCVAPDTCHCNLGYVILVNYEFVFNSSNPAICEPVCEPECGDHSKCTAPNECECDSGYRAGNYTNDHRCFPICDKPCFNGFCKSPNKCACLEGYKPHHVLNEDMCEPICNEECVNAKCSEPNRCTCLDGYDKLILRSRDGSTRISENVCTPICFAGCPNGTCVSPGHCECNAGYVLGSLPFNRTGNYSVEAIVLGDSRNRTSRETCQPLCEPDCPKGSTCVAPNQCRVDIQLNQQDFNDFPKVLTRVVSSTEKCDDDDNLYKENDTCVCKYESDKKICARSALCAVIFVNHTETVEKFIDLQRIVFPNTTFGRKNSQQWHDSKCSEQCRISVIRNNDRMAAYHTTEQCYTLKMHNATTGLLSTMRIGLPFFVLMEEQLPICSLKIEPTCTARASSVTSSRVGAVVGGVSGAILLIGLIVGIVIMIYSTRRKGRTIGGFGGISASNGDMLDHTETMESPLHTVDSSHL